MKNFFDIDLIKELGIDALPEEDQEKTLLNIGETINQLMLARVLDELSAEDQEEFSQILKASPEDEETISLFLKERIANLDQIAQEVIADYKKGLVDFMDQVTK